MLIDYKLIGQRVKTKRKEKDLTQENIAEKLDISVSYISRIERGAVKISLETLVKISDVLNVSATFLLDGSIISETNYLQSEFSDIIKEFNSDNMSLILDIAKSISKHNK